MSSRPLILASSSIYRRQLLERLRLPFATCVPALDESALPGEQPRGTALRLALAKAQAAASIHPQALVIGSDQVADLAGKALGKPGNHGNAVVQLQAMRGKSVIFHTALCMLDAASGRYQLENIPSTVQLRQLDDTQIENYLRLDQPYDCAGSAKIESLGITLVQRIDSTDPTALIGLPLMALTRMLENEGVDVI